jgi:hypothetical protein
MKGEDTYMLTAEILKAIVNISVTESHSVISERISGQTKWSSWLPLGACGYRISECASPTGL